MAAASASGNMGTKTCGLPLSFQFEPHPNGFRCRPPGRPQRFFLVVRPSGVAAGAKALLDGLGVLGALGEVGGRFVWGW